MTLEPREPTPIERRRRLRRLGTVRRLGPVAGALGRRWLRAWIDRRLQGRLPTERGFYLPLPFLEAAWGRLPRCSLPVASVGTILADWVVCDGAMHNTTDYFLGAGDWSPLVRSTDGDPVREEARQIQTAEGAFQETEIYEALVGELSAADPTRRQGRTLRSRADVDAYFERFLRLFRSIEAQGVLPHHELDERQLQFNSDRGLGIAIDADGSIHRLQGANHRWAIAQVLGIAEVPVEVRLVHVDAVTPDLLRDASRT